MTFMDVKVYKKEEVKQPSGTEYVYKPDIIDIVPSFTTNSEGIEYLSGAEILEDNTKELLEQQSALATIWQRGLDPVEPEDGIRWTQALLEEINTLQLMEDIIEAVSSVSNSVSVGFDSIKSTDDVSYLTYKLSINA